MADRRRRTVDPEAGLAIVVALLVTMISFIVVTAVLARALHNVSQSGSMRKRMSAVNAAEAGLNIYWKSLEKTTLLSLSTGDWKEVAGAWEYQGNQVASKPDGAVFLLRVRYYKENPCAVPGSDPATPRQCSSSGLTSQSLTQDPFPETVYAIVRSIGCVPASYESSQNDIVNQCWGSSDRSKWNDATPTVRRVLETVMRLRSRYGGVSGAVSASYVCLDQGADLTMKGDLYVMGASMTGPAGWPADCSAGVVVGSGDKLTMTTGNLYAAQGDLAVSNGGTMDIYGDVWARDAVHLGEDSVTPVPTDCTNVKICVHGNVTGSSITVGSQAAVQGDVIRCDPACPPTVLTFPQLVWDPTDWQNWQIVDVTPEQVPTVLQHPTARTVYHVPSTISPCIVDLTGAAKVTFDISVDVAVVGECRFEMNSSTSLVGAGTLMLVSAWPGTPGSPTALPPSSCGGDGTGDTTQTNNGFKPGPRDIYMHNNPETSGPNLFFYTPCSLKIDNNQNPLKGQLVARFLWIKNGANVDLVSVSSDGVVNLPGQVAGFSQDVRYIVEIPVSSALTA